MRQPFYKHLGFGFAIKSMTTRANHGLEIPGSSLKNMSEIERLMRTLLACAFMMVASHGYWWLMIPAMILFMSGYSAHCPMYQAARRNDSKARVRYYRSQLPKYNPQPVFIFSDSGRKVYANRPAQKQLGAVKQLTTLLKNSDLTLDSILNSEEVFSIQYQASDRVYTLTLRSIRNASGIAAFATDITKVIEVDREIIETQKEVVRTMGAIGETRSRETGNHVIRVAEYSRLLAIKVGMSEQDAELLKMASPMHDIGKVGIADAILNKPGKLSEDEFEIMKTHAELGYEMLRYSDRSILKAAATVAHEHHEKWDGSGYPRRLKGNDIHLFARITALADVFDALGSQRVYKDAWPLDKTLLHIKEQSGKHFDPVLVELFLDSMDEILAIRDEYEDEILENIQKVS